MGASDRMMTTDLAELVRYHGITQFLYREARLQDEHRFLEWEALWTDDATYWIPANGEQTDPELDMSILYDNRSRIGLRIRQFLTGKRYSQMPTSRLRRVIGNVEVLGDEPGGTRVTANMVLYESHRRGQTVWAARNEYLLRQVDGQWRLAFKKVALVNNDKALTTMAFLM
ncbi:MAG: aromatic-ring-hydroxylating dioxygenase subunit beta [Hydrogenophaga sp.]|uniref:aromatic-ring-hydroxylating dioxygenase subunit beta n=1 Tax=Hydrogenophaga sp. TaxID=1904254 RepID=UPI003D14FFBA